MPQVAASTGSTGMEGDLMIVNDGIAVNTWVNLNSSCAMEPEVYADELQIEFGSRGGSLRLVIAEEMVDQLVVVLADAQARFREMDEEAERETTTPG